METPICSFEKKVTMNHHESAASSLNCQPTLKPPYTSWVSQHILKVPYLDSGHKWITIIITIIIIIIFIILIIIIIIIIIIVLTIIM